MKQFKTPIYKTNTEYTKLISNNENSTINIWEYRYFIELLKELKWLNKWFLKKLDLLFYTSLENYLWNILIYNNIKDLYLFCRLDINKKDFIKTFIKVLNYYSPELSQRQILQKLWYVIDF